MNSDLELLTYMWDVETMRRRVVGEAFELDDLVKPLRSLKRAQAPETVSLSPKSTPEVITRPVGDTVKSFTRTWAGREPTHTYQYKYEAGVR